MEEEELEVSNGKRRVRFRQTNVVSAVFVTRDKYTPDEVKTLFYTHDEAMQFSQDYHRETHRAEETGQTWYV